MRKAFLGIENPPAGRSASGRPFTDPLLDVAESIVKGRTRRGRAGASSVAGKTSAQSFGRTLHASTRTHRRTDRHRRRDHDRESALDLRTEEAEPRRAWGPRNFISKSLDRQKDPLRIYRLLGAFMVALGLIWIAVPVAAMLGVLRPSS